MFIHCCRALSSIELNKQNRALVTTVGMCVRISLPVRNAGENYVVTNSIIVLYHLCDATLSWPMFSLYICNSVSLVDFLNRKDKFSRNFNNYTKFFI